VTFIVFDLVATHKDHSIYLYLLPIQPFEPILHHQSTTAMPAPVNTIRNIQNTLNSLGSSYSASSQSNILVNLGGLMGKHHPPGLSLRPRRGSAQNQSAHSAPKRVHQPSIRILYTGRRSSPPPPPNDEHASPAYFDPNSDEQFNPTRTVIYDSYPQPSPPLSTSTTSSRTLSPKAPSFTPSHIPTQIALAPDSESRSKIVAGILLHRVHAVGKPMRRKTVGPKEYVRSGLSTTVTAGC
jgi:hypothetical protein